MAEPLFVLTTRPMHQFGPPRRIAAEHSPSRREQVERACLACQLVKITVIGDRHPRQWRIGNGAQFVDIGGVPGCAGQDIQKP